MWTVLSCCFGHSGWGCWSHNTEDAMGFKGLLKHWLEEVLLYLKPLVKVRFCWYPADLFIRIESSAKKSILRPRSLWSCCNNLYVLDVRTRAHHFGRDGSLDFRQTTGHAHCWCFPSPLHFLFTKSSCTKWVQSTRYKTNCMWWAASLNKEHCRSASNYSLYGLTRGSERAIYSWLFTWTIWKFTSKNKKSPRKRV